MALTLACQSLGFTAPLAPMRSGAVRMVALDEPSAAPAFSVMDMPGISGPLGFFDPMVPQLRLEHRESRLAWSPCVARSRTSNPA